MFLFKFTQRLREKQGAGFVRFREILDIVSIEQANFSANHGLPEVWRHIIEKAEPLQAKLFHSITFCVLLLDIRVWLC